MTKAQMEAKLRVLEIEAAGEDRPAVFMLQVDGQVRLPGGTWIPVEHYEREHGPIRSFTLALGQELEGEYGAYDEN